MTIKDAYALRKSMMVDSLLGGVLIPERHASSGSEHLRVIDKMSMGCSFFVSQCVYDVESSKAFLSDYQRRAAEIGVPCVPIIFTLAPCGSEKMLTFMKYLGVSIPKWVESDLLRSADMLERSVHRLRTIWDELWEFADEMHIPIGCNVESVSLRAADVEASLEILESVIDKTQARRFVDMARL